MKLRMIEPEKFAELCAALESSPDPVRVLAAAGFTPDAWSAAEQHFLGVLVAEVESGDSALGRRYLAAYFAAYERHSPPAPERAPFDPSETAIVNVDAAMRGSGGMPFRRPVAPEPDTDETLPTVSQASTTLPFNRSSGPRPTIPSAEDGGGTLIGSPETPPVSLPFKRQQSGETIAAPEQAAGPAVPFERVMVDLMLVERYASLAAELRRHPDSAEEVMTHFGLATKEQRERIHQFWSLRFKANPDLFARFNAVVEKKLASEEPRSESEPKPPRDESGSS